MSIGLGHRGRMGSVAEWRTFISAALSVAAAVTISGGCAAPRPPEQRPTTVQIDAREYSRVFRAAVLTLRDAGFHVDRRDYRFGRVTSAPLPQATAAEFWQPTVTRTADPLRSTLNYQRLIAEVSLQPVDGDAGAAAPATPSADGPQRYVASVQVIVEQLEQPLQFVTNSSSRPFASLHRLPAEWARRGVPDRYWQEAGRDTQLASSLLQQIVQRSLTLPESPDPLQDSPPGVQR